MTEELRYLTYTAMLTASLWIPYVISQVVTNGIMRPQNYVDPTPRPVPFWGKRTYRAHLNAVESFAPFAALVLIVFLTNKANAMTAFWTMSFFWIRVAYTVLYWIAIPYIRTFVFTLGYVCVCGIFWEVIR